MIQLYSGVPGAGKTYKMVADLDKFLSEKPEVNVVANIRSLKLPHENFDDLLNEYFPDKSLTIPQRIELFFDYEFQQNLNGKFGGPIMYVLDECQLYFPRRTSLPNTEAYLQRHRHLGHYLYLATQASKLINPNIVALIEVEYYAVRRALSLFGEMRYRVKSPQANQLIKHFSIRPKKRIFALYQSFEATEIQKPKRELLFKFWPLLLLPIAAYFFYDRILNTEKRVERLTGRPAVSSVPSKTTVDIPPESGGQNYMRAQNSFESQEPQMVRVFLMVVKTADKSLTVDPETNSVVELKALASRGVKCSGDTCFYDKLVKDIPKPYESSVSSNSFSRGYTAYAPSVSSEKPSGAGSFVEAEMVPAPDRW